MEGVWIFQDSEFARFLHIKSLHKVLNMAEIKGSEYVLGFKYVRVLNICKFLLLWQGSEYVWSTILRVLNKSSVLNMLGLRTLQGCEYEGYTGCWICLNMPNYPLIMSQYAQMCLNNSEYDGICCIYLKKKSAEYARILNVSSAVYSIRSLYKFLSSYQDRGVFKMKSVLPKE